MLVYLGFGFEMLSPPKVSSPGQTNELEAFLFYFFSHKNCKIQLIQFFLKKIKENLAPNFQNLIFQNLIFKVFFFKQKTAYEIGVRLVGSEMCIRDRIRSLLWDFCYSLFLGLDEFLWA